MKLSSQILLALAGAQLAFAGTALAADSAAPATTETQPAPKTAETKPAPKQTERPQTSKPTPAPKPRPRITEDYCPPCGRG